MRLLTRLFAKILEALNALGTSIGSLVLFLCHVIPPLFPLLEYGFLAVSLALATFVNVDRTVRLFVVVGRYFVMTIPRCSFGCVNLCFAVS